MRKVSVILSVYKPNKKFLIKQLKSIDKQTYENIELLINDDCPNDRCDKTIFEKTLKKVKYRFLKYQKDNLGYTKSFERLVNNVKHDGYIAFCDQDDIWMKNKIKYMVNSLKKTNKELAICDRQIIDKNDIIVCNSVEKSRKGLLSTWTSGKEIATRTPFITIAPGMSIICTTKFAKEHLPYSPYAFDKWLTCCAAFENKLFHVKKPLVKYRRHGNNVSGQLIGINSKKDYYKNRVTVHNSLVETLSEKYKSSNINIKDMVNFSNARMKKNIFKIFKYGYLSPMQAKYEILLAITPNFIFKLLLSIRRR